MNIPSEDIKDMLEDESSLGLTFATNLFIGREPSQPDDCVTIFDTYGFPPLLTLDGKDAYYYPSVQILVRNSSYTTGLELIQDIRTVLHGKGPETWNATLYTVIYCSSGPALRDWDENNRAHFIINFNMNRR